jgi:hypothetical protein
MIWLCKDWELLPINKTFIALLVPKAPVLKKSVA